MDAVIKKISEKIYNPIIRGFFVTIERIDFFTYYDDTTLSEATAIMSDGRIVDFQFVRNGIIYGVLITKDVCKLR